MPKLELALSVRSTGESCSRWVVQVSSGGLGAILKDVGGGHYDPVTVEFEDSTVVVLGLHKDPPCADHRVGDLTPTYSASFPLTLECYGNVCYSLAMTKRFPLPTIMVTVKVRLPEACTTTMSSLASATASTIHIRSSEEEEKSLREMTRNKQAQIMELMGKIQDSGVALRAAEEEKRKYEIDKQSLLQMQDSMQRKLDDLRFPVLTDLDFDMMVSVPGGLEKMMHIMWQAQRRYENARAHVLDQWKEFEALQEHLEAVQLIENRIQEVASAGKEQSEALLQAQKANVECNRLQSLVSTQGNSIQLMEEKLKQCIVQHDWECKLDVMKEKTHHEKLEQVYEQVSLMQLSESEVKELGQLKVELQVENEKLEEKRLELLEALGSRFDAARHRARSTKSSEEDLLRAERYDEEEVSSLETNYEILLGREKALEDEMRQKALEYVKEIGDLKMELSHRDVQVMVLQRQLA